jgi:hypothetical protein
VTRGVTVALLSDTHGSLDPRVAELAAGCDHAVHGGDVGAAAVLDALQPRGHLLAVSGNNDLPAKWPQDDLQVLAELPEEASLELPGGTLVVIHGHRAGAAARRHAWLRRHYPQARAVVYGHSHRLVCDLEAEPWVLNPGAAGRVRTYGGPSCLVLTATPARWDLAVHRFPLRGRAGVSAKGA